MLRADRYPWPVESVGEWSVERHLADKPQSVVDLYERFIAIVATCGPHTVSVTKTAIAFRGTRRGFAGAKPRNNSLDGFLDLQHKVRDERFLRVSPYTKSVFVHQFRITDVAQLRCGPTRRFICSVGRGGIPSWTGRSRQTSDEGLTAPVRCWDSDPLHFEGGRSRLVRTQRRRNRHD